jgi:hypothetical protein
MKDAWSGRLFGLTIRSELHLPFPSEQIAGPKEAQVRIGFGAIPPVAEPLSRCGENGLQLDVEDVGRFRIENGRDVTIDPAANASERNLRAYLLGSAFGALLHQRGLLPLHANAVVVAGSAFAFVGRSGAGKSSLAGWFQDRGHAVLADDVCAVAFDEAGAPLVEPGVPRLRLWQDALERAGHDPAALERSFDAMDKFDMPARNPAAAPAPLAGCYWLDEPDDAAPMTIERLTGARAAHVLVSNTYRGHFSTLLGRTAPHLRLCAEVARRLPVFRVARRKDSEQFNAVARELERDLLRLAGERPAEL